MTTIDTKPDVSSLVHAIEARDTAGMLAWYAPDATLTLVDRDHTPSSPTVLTGADEIGGHLADVCSRDMSHEVRDLVATPDAIAFTEHCRYPDGVNVLCATVATLRGGRITEQTAVQAWDA